jgi:hypothetical protein
MAQRLLGGLTRTHLSTLHLLFLIPEHLLGLREQVRHLGVRQAGSQVKRLMEVLPQPQLDGFVGHLTGQSQAYHLLHAHLGAGHV